jgi:site-specific DNA-cytosine methylase
MKNEKYPELIAHSIPAPDYTGKPTRMKRHSYASIVPLIGGETIGIMEALGGQLPEYMLSYTPFANNDEHFVSYLRENRKWKGDYIHLDAIENFRPKPVDVVNSVCPCAGLSSYSTTSSADSAVNEWLYTTAEYVLNNIGPKVFWGENAPRLFTSAGKKVADRLYEIGRRYGYSLNLYYTESHLHGLCQKRPRTFYFFTRSDYAPIFRYWRRDLETIEKVLSRKAKKNDPMNIVINEDDPARNPWIAYAMHKTNSERICDLQGKIEKTTGFIGLADQGLGETLLEVADWMDSHEDPLFKKTAGRAREMQGKLDDGKGYWGHGPTYVTGVAPSLIGAQPLYMLNIKEERFLTIRECMRIMGMPDDFNLVGERPKGKVNHICQNVPVGTARDMMTSVIDFLEGRCDFSSCTFVRQNNKRKSYEANFSQEDTHCLSGFAV